MHKSGTGYTCDMHVWGRAEGLVCLHVSDFECKANVITLECKANTNTPAELTHLFVDDLPSPETPACGDGQGCGEMERCGWACGVWGAL
jgi:hypothetical protein